MKLYLFIVLLVLQTSAIASDINFTHITIEDGLSQSSVKCIFQDSQGFMWFGTADGLNKFDGYSFSVYSNDPTVPYSVSGNDISVIFENPYDSVLWIATQDGGLNRFNRDLDRFIPYKMEFKNKLRIPSNNIRAMAATSDGKLWIGSFYAGLFSIQNEDSGYYQPESLRQKGLNNINCLAVDHNDNLWIGTNSGLYKWSSADRNEDKSPDKVILNDKFPYQGIRALSIDYQGNIWAGSVQNGVYVYHPVSKNLVHYQMNENELPSNSIRALQLTKDGKMWTGTTEGLSIYDNITREFTTIRNHPDEPNSLNNNIVYSIFEDRSGIIWVGTYLGGINKYDPLQSRFPKYRNFITNGSAQLNDIRSIVKDDEENLWIGTNSGLIETPDPSSGQERANATKLHFKNSMIASLAFCPETGLFFSSDDSIFLKDRKGDFRNITNEISRQTGLNITRVTSSEIKSKHTVWLATQQALLKYNCREKTYEPFIATGPEGEAQALYILCMLEDYAGKLWLGTFFGELYVFDVHTEQFERIQLNDDLVSFTKIFSICETQPGEIWLGTNRGLYNLNTETLEIKRFLSSDGLPNNVVYSVIGDAQGNIWCSTNKGISCYKRKSGTFLNYTQKDGLQSNEFNQDAYFKSNNGTIYVGGINGLNIFHPSDIMANTFIPPVIITEMEIHYQRITPESNPDLLSRQISQTDEIQLSYKKNNFSFEYTALSYSLPERNHYRYCLTKEGEPDVWIEAGNRRFATFTNVNPGTYFFKVRGSNSDGLWNENPEILKIIITPPFWQLWWFKALLVLVLTFSVYAIFYLRIRAERQKKIQLERRVAAKTQQLIKQKNHIQEQNTELISLNERMKQKNKLLNKQNKQISRQRDDLIHLADQLKENNQAKIQLYTTVSHELKTPLTLILDPIREILRQKEGIRIHEVLNKLKMVQKNASKLLITIQQMLDFRKMEINKMEMHVSKFNLVSFVQETASYFNNLASKGRYHFEVRSNTDNVKLWGDKQKLEKVIFNLLSNAFKYTKEGGNISVNLEEKKNERRVILTFEDNGSGISKENMEHIFDRFYQPKAMQLNSITEGGLGLAIAKKYVEMHHGTIYAESNIGTGSRFIVELPLGREHFEEQVTFTDHTTLNKDILISSIGEFSEVNLNSVETSKDRKKPLILLVESDRDLQKYLVEILSKYYRIEPANSEKSIMKLAEEKHPELVIADLGMNNTETLNCCIRLKSEFGTSHIPYLVLSSHNDTENKVKALKAGVDMYIPKPLDLQFLIHVIENLIEGRKKLRMKFEGNNLYTKETSPANSTDQQFLDEAIQHVEANIDNAEFNVEVLCRLLNLSQPQVYRKIKALTNVNITEFIRNIRLRKAAELLRSGTFKVNEVAYKAGFNDPNYFTKIFTKTYGMTPTEYVKSFY